MIPFYYVASCGRSSWVSRRAAALSPVRARRDGLHLGALSSPAPLLS